VGKSILFRLFRLGALPDRIRPLLELEGITALDEGIGASLSAKRLKGPGKRYFHKKSRFPACIAVTNKRVAVFAFRNKEIINIPAEKINPDNFSAGVLDNSILVISFESSSFLSGWSGAVEIKFRTPKARALYEAIRSLNARLLSARSSAG
jgi:hypothetical protein